MKIKLVFPFWVMVVFSFDAMGMDDTMPTIEKGAAVFVKRCTLCHGTQGMGEGEIPLRIKDYPNTNIMTASKAKTKQEVYDAIVFGGILPNISVYMPPMGNELTWTELESVSLFIYNLRKSPETYLKMLQHNEEENVNTARVGRSTFEARCVLCHGVDGEGDGRMSRVIKSPPPFNLTKSQVPEEYLKLIIGKGGEAVGRSGQMPPWGDQLSPREIDAVVAYIIGLRK